MSALELGPQTVTSLAAGAHREWLVADGLGGFAMGTVAGLATRRYHGLLVVATDPPGGRMLALAALDATLVLGDRRVELATHRWADGALAPRGHEHLAAFTLDDGVPRWRWQVGDVVLERELAMVHGRPAVALTHRLLAASGPVRLELAARGTWRDVHGERTAAGAPGIEPTANGFAFEGRYRVAGPDFRPEGVWHLGVRHDEEDARGLAATEDVVLAGRFVADLVPGEAVGVRAWADDLADEPPPAAAVIDAARHRARGLLHRAGAGDAVDGQLVLAADAFVVDGPSVVAGYPWFGDWSRDTMLSYEGLLLATGRAEEGRRLLERAAAGLSEGMLANTADAGELAYNTVDGTLWFVHAVGRHVAATGDDDLAAALLPALRAIVEHHVGGTRFGIGVDPADGLLAQGADGVALTWMDARVDGVPVTPRQGKPIEVNALWVNALATTAALAERAGTDATDLRALAEPGYRGRHRGDPAARDRAYHEGTVWPWLLGPYVEAARRTGVDASAALAPLERHLADWGVGSVSETADGDAPHAATGAPFQAWSVAELLRARRLQRSETGR